MCTYIYMLPAVQCSLMGGRRCCVDTCRNQVDKSIDSFDRVVELDEHREPYMWQRGLSLYYAERYSEAMAQFELDVSVNPNDTEESIWHWLAHVRRLRTEGKHDAKAAVAIARANLLKVGTDPRPVMRSAMELFSGGPHRGSDDSDAIHVLALDAAGGPRSFDGGAQHDRFCAHLPPFLFWRAVTVVHLFDGDVWLVCTACADADLYLALWHEATGDEPAALKAMEYAVGSPYGPASNDYMWHVALVHAALRGWATNLEITPQDRLRDDL